MTCMTTPTMTIKQHPLHQPPCHLESEPSRHQEQQLTSSPYHPPLERRLHPSKRRKSTRRLPLSHALLLLTILLHSPSFTQAKYAFRKKPSKSTARAIPTTTTTDTTDTNKRRRHRTKDNHSKRNNKTTDKNKTTYHIGRHVEFEFTADDQSKGKKTKKPHRARTILRPRPKRASPSVPKAATIDIRATVTQNEDGQHVLVLTPESVDAVQKVVDVNPAVASKRKKAVGSIEVIATRKGVEEEVEDEEEAEPESEPEPEPEPQILFYDPEEVPQTKAGDPPGKPERAYDKDGKSVDLDGRDVEIERHTHSQDREESEDENGGKSDEQDEVQTDDEPSTSSKGNNSSNGNKSSSGNSSSSGKNSSKGSNSSSRNIRLYIPNPQTQDQMIIISTVATMALLVGALSARRLRSRQFLSFCIENESLEDDLAFDQAYTAQSTVGASSFYGGYDTFGDGERYGGDLRWRGDLEKFDV